MQSPTTSGKSLSNFSSLFPHIIKLGSSWWIIVEAKENTSSPNWINTNASSERRNRSDVRRIKINASSSSNKSSSLMLSSCSWGNFIRARVGGRYKGARSRFELKGGYAFDYYELTTSIRTHTHTTLCTYARGKGTRRSSRWPHWPLVNSMLEIPDKAFRSFVLYMSVYMSHVCISIHRESRRGAKYPGHVKVP